MTTELDTSDKPTAQPLTAYEMPFPCGEVWTGTTRSSHSPSVRSIDFNRTDDFTDPVVAAAAGVVTTAVTGRNRPSYGQFVVVDHGNGESTLYAHLDSVTVTVGQAVSAGTQVGTLGNTGNSYGAHLHFEERLGSTVVDSWFHGARYVFGTVQESQNCGGSRSQTFRWPGTWWVTSARTSWCSGARTPRRSTSDASPRRTRSCPRHVVRPAGRR